MSMYLQQTVHVSSTPTSLDNWVINISGVHMEGERKIRASVGNRTTVVRPVSCHYTVLAWLIKPYLVQMEEENSVLEEFRKC
jgi:hypothetical protein